MTEASSGNWVEGFIQPEAIYPQARPPPKALKTMRRRLQVCCEAFSLQAASDFSHASLLVLQSTHAAVRSNPWAIILPALLFLLSSALVVWGMVALRKSLGDSAQERAQYQTEVGVRSSTG
jgi:hypothetical protein